MKRLKWGRCRLYKGVEEVGGERTGWKIGIQDEKEVVGK